jgi:hypothetical protein
MVLIARALPEEAEAIIAQFIRTNFVELEGDLDRSTLKSVVLMLIHSMVVESFESFPQRNLAGAELEFLKGENSQKTTNQRSRMRHVHNQTRESLKEVSRVQHRQL